MIQWLETYKTHKKSWPGSLLIRLYYIYGTWEQGVRVQEGWRLEMQVYYAINP